MPYIILISMSLITLQIIINDVVDRKVKNKSILILFFITLFSYAILKDKSLLKILTMLNYKFSIYCLLFGFLIYFAKAWGAGDAKLLTIMALFVDSKDQMDFILIVTILGVFVSFATIFISSLLKVKKHKINSVPYGVALSLSFMVYGTVMYFN
ncbi:prepilin peptidase [Vibrio mediterranei]|uniref:prepilin peptidase n=1 Tax=Vibrio mediterranei TaxID=689 RepID=UPI0016A9B3B5|nr:prepilin peptidase [Vibrio mediterranei]NOI26768.1 hypothetical protein [Vibrio mediterranei]